MIARIEYRSDDGTRKAVAFRRSTGEWHVAAKHASGHDVAVWTFEATLESAQRICESWVDLGRVAADPVPSWRHVNGQVVLR